MTRPVTRGAARPVDTVRARVPWVGVAALVSGHALGFVVRYGTAVVLPGLRADFGADEAALGALAAAYFWPYAFMQPVAGVLADSWGPRRSIALWLTGAALGTVLFALAPSYPVAVLGRAVSGAGVGVVYVCAIAVIGQWFDPKRFGTLSGLYAATGTVGGLFAAGPLSSVVDALGWRLAFGLIAALLFVVAVAVAIAVPELERRGVAAAAPRRRLTGVWAGVGQALALRNVWLMGVYAFIALGVLSAMQGLWTVPFLMDVYGLTGAQAADVLGAWSIGLLVGMPAWAYLTDRVARTRKVALFVSVVLHTLPWVGLALAPASVPREALFVGVFYLAVTNGCWMPAYVLVQTTAPRAIAGTAMGVFNFSFFAGAATYQQLSGWVLAQFPRRGGHLPAEAYQVLFALFAASLTLAGLAVLFSRDPELEGRPAASGKPTPNQ